MANLNPDYAEHYQSLVAAQRWIIGTLVTALAVVSLWAGKRWEKGLKSCISEGFTHLTKTVAELKTELSGLREDFSEVKNNQTRHMAVCEERHKDDHADEGRHRRRRATDREEMED